MDRGTRREAPVRSSDFGPDLDSLGAIFRRAWPTPAAGSFSNADGGPGAGQSANRDAARPDADRALSARAVASAEDGVEGMNGKVAYEIHIFPRANWLGRRKWYFHIRRKMGGKIVAQGEGYSNRYDCAKTAQELRAGLFNAEFVNHA
jgi:hypothetical protein